LTVDDRATETAPASTDLVKILLVIIVFLSNKFSGQRQKHYPLSLFYLM